MIYLAIVASDQLRIGYSRNPQLALKALARKVRCQPEIVAVLTGSKAEEQRLHARFAAAALGDGWYRLSADVLDLCAQLRAASGDPSRRHVFRQWIADPDLDAAPVAATSTPRGKVTTVTLPFMLLAKVRQASETAGISQSNFMRLAMNYYADKLLSMNPGEVAKLGTVLGHGGVGMERLAISTSLRPEPGAGVKPSVAALYLNRPELFPQPAPPSPVPMIDLSFFATFGAKPPAEE